MDVQIIGELGQSEMLALAQPRGSTTPHIKKLRDTHHRLARLLATGAKDGMIAAVTGYSVSRLSILKNDPAFSELIEYYRSEVHELHLDAEQQLASLRADAIDELQERLEENPESFNNKDLMHLAFQAADRTGLGPKKTVNLTATVFTPQDIAQLKAEVSQHGTVIDITSQSVRTTSETPDSSELELGDSPPLGPLFDLT